ncbi:hypothetical protein K491DRAFT_720392 [Lophiostoma macrostomum CBS 122681]|uniref:Uncharacterized protein n=1 Tax=Lophiostoma macrostomum CBS 122681 TaxID=1314788 RepID=A0A6A6SWA5_9PLEO|nr:hypothetical protein K491DRAFT_720392 [Lophiostoma macrostomum CBS 122681]
MFSAVVWWKDDAMTVLYICLSSENDQPEIERRNLIKREQRESYMVKNLVMQKPEPGAYKGSMYTDDKLEYDEGSWHIDYDNGSAYSASTANVPPHQRGWWSREIDRQCGKIGELPRELVNLIGLQVDDLLIGGNPTYEASLLFNSIKDVAYKKSKLGTRE